MHTLMVEMLSKGKKKRSTPTVQHIFAKCTKSLFKHLHAQIRFCLMFGVKNIFTVVADAFYKNKLDFHLDEETTQICSCC